MYYFGKVKLIYYAKLIKHTSIYDNPRSDCVIASGRWGPDTSAENHLFPHRDTLKLSVSIWYWFKVHDIERPPLLVAYFSFWKGTAANQITLCGEWDWRITQLGYSREGFCNVDAVIRSSAAGPCSTRCNFCHARLSTSQSTLRAAGTLLVMVTESAAIYQTRRFLKRGHIGRCPGCAGRKEGLRVSCSQERWGDSGLLLMGRRSSASVAKDTKSVNVRSLRNLQSLHCLNRPLHAECILIGHKDEALRNRQCRNTNDEQELSCRNIPGSSVQIW